jgi:hypothetical protein
MVIWYHKGLHWHDRHKKQLTGSRLGGMNCTCASGAMGAHRHSIGRISPSSDRVRTLTGDTVGGTNLQQVVYALKKIGVTLSGPYYGMALVTLWSRLRSNHGAVVQGSSIATKGTRWSGSSTFQGNHAWYLARGRGWYQSGSYWYPKEILFGDPLLDGRPAQPYPRLKGFQWIPRYYVEKFLRNLVVGDHLLGADKAYAALTRDTWYHHHPKYTKYGYVSMSPTRIKLKSGYNVRSSPMGTKIKKTVAGYYFEAWGRVDNGPLINGSRRWYCNHEGNRWIHASARAA